MSGLHPGIRKELDQIERDMREAGLSDIHSNGVADARAFLASLAPKPEDLPSIHSVKDRTIPGPAGEIPVRIYRPGEGTDLPVLLWFHGGGWVLGNLDHSELVCRSLANDANCVVVSVDYRLAPETRFPGALLLPLRHPSKINS